jgi:multidrug efflux pump subunit AcrB
MIFSFFYKRPYALAAIIFAAIILGIVGLKVMPQNLFPDSDRPQVIVLTQVPGATAKIAANTVSKPIEEELARLSKVRDISSVNVANFSIVKAEFDYSKGLSAAAVDVSNALSIVKNKLPRTAQPAVYTAGSFTLPVEVISLIPKNDSITLNDIRKVADSFIKPSLLANPAIGNVEVFGGHQSAINIAFDPLKARKYNLSFGQIAQAIQKSDQDIPMGFVKGDTGFFTLTFYGQADQVEKLRQLPVAPNITLGQVAGISWGQAKRFSGYIGNGQSAIAMAIQRSPSGSVLAVSEAAREAMKQLEAQYPNIDFQISDTQRELVETANENMLEALRDAIVYTLIVMFFFLGNLRAILTAGLTIPLVFLGTLTVIYLTGGEMNIIIYTAIILALGLLVDNAVVVLENIERHIVEEHEDTEKAVINGTKEVDMPVFAGTLATAVIVFPLMFVGDFPQQIFRPLIETLIIALAISYFLSVTFIPKVSAYLYRNGAEKTRFEKGVEVLYEKTLGRIVTPYLDILQFSNGGWSVVRKIALTLGVLIILAMTLKNVMPLIGKDTMPPMDTGIIKAHIQFSANDTVESAEKKLQPFLAWLNLQPEVKRSSIAFGSEAGVLSLGSGNLPNEATITVNCVNRFQRKDSLWEIESRMRDELHKLQDAKTVDVYDFGATALSSIKAPVDVRLRSSNLEGLAEKAHEVADAMHPIKGFTSISQSWDNDFTEIKVDIDRNKALYYGLTPQDIAAQIPIKGQVIALTGNLDSMNTQLVRLYLKGRFGKNIEGIKALPIQSHKGPIPLDAVATLTPQFTAAKVERDQMMYSIDVSGYREKRPITHLTSDTDTAIQKVDTTGFIVTQEGDKKQLDDSFQRMIKAVGMGVVLLILALMVIYRSVILSLIMIVVLPLALIGAAWGMLAFDKPSCMPSLLGILLLFGIIIKNAILLVDFYQDSRQAGMAPFDAAKESVRVRFRPVMMTAFATIAGMVPIALEMAVGLERLSPLADVAIGGLLVGTILTLVYVPMFAYAFDKGDKNKQNA